MEENQLQNLHDYVAKVFTYFPPISKYLLRSAGQLASLVTKNETSSGRGAAGRNLAGFLCVY